MQPGREFEVEPELLLTNSVMCLRRVRLRIPVAEPLIIQLGRVARDYDPARQRQERLKQPNVVAFTVVVSIDTRTPPCAREIWRVAVHQFISRKTLGREELDRITFD